MENFKKITVLVLCLVLSISVISIVVNRGVELSDSKTQALKMNFAKKTGDVNNDGYVDRKDLTYLSKEICKELFTDSKAVSAADVNQDNCIDMRDYVKLKKILGLTPSKPSNWTDPEITPPTPED